MKPDWITCNILSVSIIKHKSSKFPIWFSKILNYIVLEKNRMHAKYKTTQRSHDYFELFNLMEKFKTEYKKMLQSTEK